MSLYFEVIVGNIFSGATIFCYIKQSDNSSWWRVSVDGKGNATCNELFDFLFWHIIPVVGINKSPDEGRSRSTHGIISFFEVTRRVDIVNLETFIWIPTAADHAGWHGILIAINDLSHDAGSRLNRRKSSEFICLNVNIVPHISSDFSSMRWCPWSIVCI